jgi:CelD/BcsL family acetyltransferase involved in cellulose biosynthesis
MKDVSLSQPVQTGKIRLITNPAEVESIRSDWLACLARFPHHHIQANPDWLALELELAPPGAVKPLVAVLEEDGQIAALAPFRIIRRTLSCRLGYLTVARFSVKILDLCGEKLIAPDDIGRQAELLAGSTSSAERVDAVFLECVPLESTLWKTIETSSVIKDNYWVFMPDPPTVHRLIRFGDSMDRYLAEFSADARNKLRRSVRKLKEAAAGDLELVRVTGKNDVESLLREMEEVSRKGWKGRSLGRVVRPDEPTIRRFQAYADKGWLLCYVLRAKGQAIAYRLVMRGQRMLHSDETAYDEAWRQYQPGKVLVFLALQDLFGENRPEVLDFGYGDDATKSLFATDSYPEASVYLVRKRPYPWIAFSAVRLCAMITRVVRKALNSTGLLVRARRLLRRRD